MSSVTKEQAHIEQVPLSDPVVYGVRPERRSRWSLLSSHLPLTTVLAMTAGVIAWWVAALIVSDKTVLPTPATVARQLLTLAGEKGGATALWPNLEASLIRVLVSWAISVVGGITIAALMYQIRFVRVFLRPYVEFIRPLPPLAFAPLLLVWLGIGETSKITLIVLGSVPLMIVATLSAAEGVDISRIRAAQTLGASRRQITTRVIIPSALPEIVTAMRLTSGLCWGVLVAAELLASNSGLGYMISQASNLLDTPIVFAGIVIIAILAFAMDGAMRLTEHYAIHWKGKG